ncbi:hypothetical protein [Pseudomonas putida]|uniref:hypothetical protein n=1 Tax=Pseudomonas putida TaxID=303 RepID=UPI000CC8A805|nr:hypothetical protein [Pseudomonas putida]PNG87587.1 hypothetical protein CBL13_01451 [Pseudomonas putida]
MPTENRSSNTEMVSFPRELSDDLAELIAHRARVCGGGAFEIWEAICEGFAAPAQQPQPEPIAWMVGTAFWWTKEEAERDAAETGLPIVGLGAMTGAAPAEQHQGEPVAWMDPRSPQMHATISNEVKQHNVKFGGAPASAINGYTVPLYTHADPGDLERCEARLHEVASLCATVEQERDTLRAQLAEAHALLRDIELTMDAQEDSVSLGYDIEMRMATIQRPSASAEPSAPKCTYCGDTGQIMVGRSGDANDGNAPIMEPCEDCDGSGSSGGQMHSNGMDEPEYEPFKCETCDGFGSVPDGEITGAGGVEFESGPIQCVKDCPDCKPSAPVDRDERALIELALSEYGKATGKHVLPGGINENQDGFVHGFLVRAALERKPS